MGLCEKILARGWRAVVRTTSDERLEQLDEALWTYGGDSSFHPHGRADEPRADKQPILFTKDMDCPNTPDVLMVCDGAEVGDYEPFRRVIYLFDGHDTDAVNKARDLWKRFKTHGMPMSYYQQSESGGWVEKMRVNDTQSAT